MCGRCGTFVHRLSFYVAGVGLYDMVETSQILIGGCFLCWRRFGTRFSSKVSRLSVNLMCVCMSGFPWVVLFCVLKWSKMAVFWSDAWECVLKWSFYLCGRVVAKKTWRVEMTKKKNKWYCIHEERRFSPGKTSSFHQQQFIGFWWFCLVLTWRNPQMAISVREWSSTKRSWVAYFQTNPYCCCNHRFRLFSLGFTRGTSLVKLDGDQFGTIIQTPSIPGFGDLQRVLINLASNLMLAVYWGVASSHVRF